MVTGVAKELASVITANAPVAVQQSLQVVDALTSGDDERGWELTRAARRMGRLDYAIALQRSPNPE